MTERDTTPEDAFEALRRLHNCNWNQLAKRLGVTPKTLRAWRSEGAGANGSMRMQHLMEASLRAANAEWLLLQTNWTNVRSIGGKR